MKCSSCGLTNYATATHCRRCAMPLSAPLSDAAGTWQPMSTVQGWNAGPAPYDAPPAYGGAAVPAYGVHIPAPVSMGIWSEGRVLVVHRNAVLPDRCVKCNAPADGGRLRRKFAWHPPAFYLLIVVGLLIYAIVAMIVQKRATLELGICAEHRRKRQYMQFAAWGFFIAALVAIPVAVSNESGAIGLLAFLFVVAALVAGLIVTNWMTAAKIDDAYVWIKGAGKEFVSGFPPARF